MDKHRRVDFLRKFAEGRHTEEEHEEFIAWVHTASQEELEAAMDTFMEISETNQIRTLPYPSLVQKLESRLDALNSSDPVQRSWFNIYKLASAAIIIAVLSSGLYYYINRPAEEPSLVMKEEPVLNDAVPGANIAVLTLADGSQISLDDANNGEIAFEAGIHIRKTAEGRLVYEAMPALTGSEHQNLFNTISTPRGGQYQINLPDGSKVWLNAASSLKYPVAFNGNERLVELKGEAYFDIAHDRAKPFRVKSGTQVVEVFGTEFNINSYENEPVIKTTLLRGSVKVFQVLNNSSAFLKPGQQSNTSSSGLLTLSQADVSQVIAWKNGHFLFNDMDLLDIMRQLERWYDVDVDYSNIPETHYNGNISRNVNLSRVLKMLEVTGQVKFKIEGKKIRVIK